MFTTFPVKIARKWRTQIFLNFTSTHNTSNTASDRWLSYALGGFWEGQISSSRYRTRVSKADAMAKHRVTGGWCLAICLRHSPDCFALSFFPQQVTNIHMQSCVFSCAQAEHEKNQYRKISTRNQLPAFNHARQYPMTAVKLMMPGGATSGLHPGSSSLG